MTSTPGQDKCAVFEDGCCWLYLSDVISSILGQSQVKLISMPQSWTDLLECWLSPLIAATKQGTIISFLCISVFICNMDMNLR